MHRSDSFKEGISMGVNLGVNAWQFSKIEKRQDRTTAKIDARISRNTSMANFGPRLRGLEQWRIIEELTGVRGRRRFSDRDESGGILQWLNTGQGFANPSNGELSRN